MAAVNQPITTIDERLQVCLENVAARKRRLRAWRALAAVWAGAGLLGLSLFLLERQIGWTSPLPPLILALGALLVAFVVTLRRSTQPTDWRSLASQIEKEHPDLDGRLITAIQQPAASANAQAAPGSPSPWGEGRVRGTATSECPNGSAETTLPAKVHREPSYLQQRIIQEALLHSRRSDWGTAISSRDLFLAQTAHWATLIVLLAALWSLRSPIAHGLFSRASESSITITPGDTSLERGNSLIVLARFAGSLPPNVELVVGQSGQRYPLVKSLADPVFGGSVPEVSSNLVYHIEYAGQRTPDYHVTVFEYPRLERADVDLKFPDYTSLPPKRIEDTRRVSAVEGSRLDLTLQLNKPVVWARLVSKEKERVTVPLLHETNRAAANLKQFDLEKSATYELQLLDAEGRTNKVPAQFVFSVLTNRTPEFRLDSPRGDIRPSPLEELTFDGTVWDDFGVKAYGLGFTVPGKETKYVELGQAVPGKEKRSFQHLMRLEDLDLGPDQVIAWFVWGDDVGPDGQLRRSTSDLYFGEIRPFEEVFREGQAMDGGSQSQQQSGQMRGPASKQAELQKQIINATWRLERDHPVPRSSAGSHSSSFSSSSSSSLAFSKAASSSPSPWGEGWGEGDRDVRQPVPVHRTGWGQFVGQVAPDNSETDPSEPPPSVSKPRPNPNQPPTYESDAAVVRDAQAEALQQTEAASRRQQDPRASALWSTAKQEMKNALDRLDRATNSPAALPDALAAEQAAYQALLKLQQHEYQVTRGQNRGGAGAGGQQMQRQLDQMDLTQSENRYETQRQAQKPQQPAERREQLQVLNRLQELARRQQDLNDRLKELQTALQEAKTDQERDEIRRRLKRLQEEEQQMLSDVDELRQRMDRPENQSRMSDERRQLDETRDDVQRAAEQAGQGSAAQALASGTRAQRQLQQMRDQVRKDSSSQFADDLREMRAQARELASRQEEISKALDAEAGQEQQKSLSGSQGRQMALDQLEKQKERMTNLVDHAARISQQAEEAEPLLSRQLYDTVRKFTQDTARNLQQSQDDLLSHGLMTRSLYDRLKEGSGSDGTKLLDMASEMLKADFLRQAGEAGQLAQAPIEDFKRGVERAAESVLGDDTESLRLAQQTLEQLTDQLQKELARQEAGQRTNRPGGLAQNSNSGALENNQTSNRVADARSGTNSQTAANQAQNENEQASGQQSSNSTANGSGSAQTAISQPGRRGARTGEQDSRQPGNEQASADQQSNGPAQGNRTGENENSNSNNQPSENSQASNSNAGQRLSQGGENQSGNGQAQANQDGNADSPNDQNGSAQAGAARDRAARSGRLSLSGGGGGGDGGDISGSLGQWLDHFGGDNAGPLAGPITGQDFVTWSDRLRDVEEMIDIPDLRNNVALARERARRLRQDYKKDLKKPDWAVVKLQVMKPLMEVHDRIADELARRQSNDNLVPIDRDPVPTRYSDLVRRYYEELGKDK